MITSFKEQAYKPLIAVLLVVFLSLTSNKLFAQETRPIQLSLINPIQLVSEDKAIQGLRINLLYGKNVAVKGLDVGLVNHSGSGGFKGLQYGFVNLTDADAEGAQLGFVNYNKGSVQGFQAAAVNSAPDMTGFQYGFINHTGDMNGLQLGIINYAEYMSKGLQIGVLNIIREGGKFPVFPVVNWSF